ncbi:MAG: putative General secretion pathway protein GspG [Parcubacteria group bacterium Athens1014_10]|nr:MAG: putative General secretion pathway protein GspG [Parcubacteria group bacterium Athens1014_10]TSD05876.1 MAG: putative General secretion pathway protein GspG [Parcubacteria group bacterium Athens0714_12]
MKTKKILGFTLLEILISIAIIGLISTIALAQVSNAREKARDVKRKADLTQIAKALELYYDDYGSYPPVSDWIDSRNGSGWFPALEPYMQAPKDPLNRVVLKNFNNLTSSALACTGGCDRTYCYVSPDPYYSPYYYYAYGSLPPYDKFILIAQLENKNDPQNIYNQKVKNPWDNSYYLSKFFDPSHDWAPSTYAITSN